MKIHSLIIAIALAATFTSHAGPIRKGGFIINKPGKYFLTRDLAVQAPPGFLGPVGVVITADGVELDLAGFAIGPANDHQATGIGIGIWLADGVQRVRVHNGRLQSLQAGVSSVFTSSVRECIFERLQIASCAGDFMTIRGDSNVIRGCTLTGIPAQHQGIAVETILGYTNEISDCTVTGNGNAGISAAQTAGLFVRRCFVEGFKTGYSVNSGCKLFDNATMNCTAPIAGNPMLIGVNN